MLLLDRPVRRNDSPMTSYIQDINETPLLTQEDEQALACRVQEGNLEARNQMVKANLRLVVSIARRFVGRGMCLSDLIQEGNLGLLHAVERFDPAQNTRFSTYAKFWIQESLGRALEKMAGPLRVPAYANDLMINWRKTTNDLHDELGRNPTDEEVAGRLRLTRRQLNTVRKALRIFNSILYLDSQEAQGTAAAGLVDTQSPGPDAELTANDEMRHVLKLLDQLPDREATILRLRHGLSGNDPMTLLEIGKQLNLTRERVRQLEKEALAKLGELVGEEA